MSRARVTIAGHAYTIGCAPGEEERIATLAGELETMMADLSDTLGDVDERTLAVMAGLSAMERLASAEAAIARLKARNEALERARENAVLALDGDDEALVTRLETVAAVVERVAGLINRDTRARSTSAPLRPVAVTDEAPPATADEASSPPSGEDGEPDAVVPSRGPSGAPTEAGGLGRLDINPAAAMRR
ncbi:MAG: hypothetical protein AcusKO_49320 [Acuticoccus sp.]